MNCNDVLILFTMDVEPVAQADGRTSGPTSLQEGEQRVREYVAALATYGFVPTFFVHPEIAEQQSALFQELRRRGSGVELHLHTVKFKNGALSYPYELGGLTRARQSEALTAARDRFSQALGFAPQLFRPGCFSANDLTYSVLHELGFVGGSISIPGRIWAGRHCVWAGAEPHPHYANAEFRQLAGGLPFVEIPLSVDRRGGLLTHPQLGFQHYADLRPGGVYAEAEDSGRDHLTMLRNIIAQLMDEKPLLKTIVVDVHNDRDFLSPTAVPAQQLRCVLDNLAPELQRHGLRPVGATMLNAVEHFKELTQK